MWLGRYNEVLAESKSPSRTRAKLLQGGAVLLPSRRLRTAAMSMLVQKSMVMVEPGSRSGRRVLSLRKRLLFSIVPLLALLTTAELAARWFLPKPADARFEQIEQIIVYLGNQPGQSIFEPDPDCFWRLKPNVVLPSEGGPAWSGPMSNSHGLRSRDVDVEAALRRWRILCFGDSSTFAFGVAFDDAWPNQLQALLDGEQPGAVEVLNAGVPGQTSYQGRRRLTRELDKWRPHLAFITFGNNDGWRWDGLSDEEHARRAGLARRLAFLQSSRSLQWLMIWHRDWMRSDSARRQLDWAQQATSSYFDPREEWTPRVAPDDFAENLRAMAADCRRHDCEPVFVVWPDQRQLLGRPTWRPPYQAAMRETAEDVDIECLDLESRFERAGSSAIERFLPNDVVHLDRAGNQFVSAAAAEFVRLRLERTPTAE
jgi:lysophospholipase L1-like esterase